MVISIAIPSAILKTNTVEGFNGTPAHPMIPAVITSGIRLGSREQIRIRKLRNKYSMQTAINRKAQTMLCFKPLMIKVLPSRKVTVVPVYSIR